MRYRDAIPTLLAPGWLQTPKNAAWLRASGDVKDSLVERAKSAVKARFAATAPRDALDSLGSERQIERGPSESDTDYAARVAGAWETWQYGGTALGVLTALSEAGYASAVLPIVLGRYYALEAGAAAVRSTGATWTVTVTGAAAAVRTVRLVVSAIGDPATVWVIVDGVHQGDASLTVGTALDLGTVYAALSGCSVTASGTAALGDAAWFVTGAPVEGEFVAPLPSGGWAVDATPDFWSKFALVFPENPWGSDPASTSDTIEQIRRLVKRWKSAHATFAGLSVIDSGNAWGYPVSAWGEPEKAWGGSVATYAP